MKVIAFAGSTSSVSINKRLVTYASSLFHPAEVELLDLNNYEAPIYSSDREEKSGIPIEITKLSEKLDSSNLIVLSLAEHNGSYSAAFKNTYDWLSRIPNRKVFGNVPVFLMAASPGGRGGAGVLEAASSRIPRDGSEILKVFSFPKFHENFADDKIVDEELNRILIEAVKMVKSSNFSTFY